MATLKSVLQERIERYEKLLERLPARKHPNLRLNCEQRNGHFRYRMVFHDEKTGRTRRKYLGKNQMNLIRELAEDEYYDTLRTEVGEVLACMKQLDAIYDDHLIQVIYESLDEGKKALVHPVGMTMQEWLDQPRETLGDTLGYRRYETGQGEKVRSKAESIIIDQAHYFEMPCKYECKLEFGPGDYLYPDLEFFDPTTQQSIYWEHFGMLDDPDYLEKALQKILRYGKHGIVLGQNLIISFETKNTALSRKWINLMFDTHLGHLKHYFTHLHTAAENKKKRRL